MDQSSHTWAHVAIITVVLAAIAFLFLKVFRRRRRS